MTVSDTATGNPAPGRAGDSDGASTTPVVSVVIPAFNEEARLPGSLARMIDFLAAQPGASELIVVDDGSRDRTAELVASASRRRADLPAAVEVRLLQHDAQQGKGAAIRTGCLAARGDYVFFVDADLATPPEESLKVLEVLRGGGPVVIGSRIQPDGTDMRASQPPRRRLVGSMFTAMRKALRVLPDIDDTQCPLKGFRRDAAQAIFARQRLRGWIFDAEVLHLARILGYPIVEVPVAWRHIEGSRVRVRPQQAYEVMRDLLWLRFVHRRPKAALGVDRR
ncbi:MAG: glycosyltransferase family 2 protein [Dehalococcoidia bacterium]|nr:glycosyltransferase family 2 protein [Dehalococcoidia bacterium]